MAGCDNSKEARTRLELDALLLAEKLHAQKREEDAWQRIDEAQKRSAEIDALRCHFHVECCSLRLGIKRDCQKLERADACASFDLGSRTTASELANGPQMMSPRKSPARSSQCFAMDLR